MWNNVNIGQLALNILGSRCHIHSYACVGQWGKKAQRCDHYKHCRLYSKSGPPWRILFFGTDSFAVESLKSLTATRGSSESIVETLEVVALSNNVPVKKFADENQLRVHIWPLGDLQARFDLGVVVSFGCLLKEQLIRQFPYGILNVHPSLLPRWRGPAPVFHTILHGDALTGVTIMQIRPSRFDVGPILQQEIYPVPTDCTTDQLASTLATKGAHLLIDTLKTLPERLANKVEQNLMGATSASKVSTSMSWVSWEDQTCEEIDRLFRAFDSRSPLRTMWMGRTVKLLDFVGKCHISLSGHGRQHIPGSITYLKMSNTLAVCCKDGWVGFKAVVLRKQLSAADFYNGYMQHSLKDKPLHQPKQCLFVSNRTET